MPGIIDIVLNLFSIQLKDYGFIKKKKKIS